LVSRFKDVDQMVGDSPPQLPTRLGRSDIQAAINLQRICVYDLDTGNDGKKSFDEVGLSNSGGTK
jgi:hypothetical protein